MTRGSRVTIVAMLTLCSTFAAGCSSNPSGVNTQVPPSTTTTAVAPSSSTAISSPTASAASITSSSPALSQTTPTTARCSPPNSPSPGSSTPKTTALVDPEAADRAAIEAVWAKYWVTSLGLSKVPAVDRLAVMDTVAVPSVATAVVTETAKKDAAGQAAYGRVVHRPYWATPVAGKSTAVMNDCMNDYNAGTLNVKTGKPVRAGVYRDNTRATFSKGAASVWRVAKIEYLVNVSC